MGNHLASLPAHNRLAGGPLAGIPRERAPAVVRPSADSRSADRAMAHATPLAQDSRRFQSDSGADAGHRLASEGAWYSAKSEHLGRQSETSYPPARRGPHSYSGRWRVLSALES